jgi:hypothetical protein
MTSWRGWRPSRIRAGPHAERANVDEAKICDYLLADAHPVGRFKARVFLSLGYTLAA